MHPLPLWNPSFAEWAYHQELSKKRYFYSTLGCQVDISQLRNPGLLTHGIFEKVNLISEKTKPGEKENAYLSALKNYDITAMVEF